MHGWQKIPLEGFIHDWLTLELVQFSVTPLLGKVDRAVRSHDLSLWRDLPSGGEGNCVPGWLVDVTEPLVPINLIAGKRLGLKSNVGCSEASDSIAAAVL